MMPVTTGTICVRNKAAPARMSTMVITASNPSGNDFPRTLTRRNNRINGCPIKDTTNAIMI